MIIRVAKVAGLATALILFILALSIGAWPCGGLFESCDWRNNTDAQIYEYHVVGGLLVVAALSAFFSLVFTMISLRKEHTWIRVVAFIWSFAAFAVAIAAEIYFHTLIYHDWSSFFATIAFTLNFTIFIIKVSQMVTMKFSPVNYFTPMKKPPGTVL